MELLEFKNQLFELLDISEMSQLPQALELADSDMKHRYIEMFGLDRDWICELYQYYLADRDGLKQDYAPGSLAKLLGALIGPCKSIADLCAGSGSLSLCTDPKAGIRAYEMEESVLPFLEFNLLIHGRKADVIRSDLLNEMTIERADGVMSNPPFNIPNNGYTECKTGNRAFVDIAYKVTRGRAALILSNSILTEEKDREFVCRLSCFFL